MFHDVLTGEKSGGNFKSDDGMCRLMSIGELTILFLYFGGWPCLAWPRSNIVRGWVIKVSEDLKTIPILCYNNPKQAKSCECRRG